MKIALIVPGGLHPSGEKEVVPSWLALFERLATVHEIHAFALRHLNEPTTYQLRGFTVHDLGRPSLPFGITRWAEERALRFALDEHGPFDLIHGFFADPAGRLAARAGRRLGIPSVVTCDSGEFVAMPEIDYGSQRTTRGKQIVAEACELATRVHVCTQFMAALARANGVEATVFPLSSVSNTSFAPITPRTSGGPFCLIQVASLSRVKSQRLLLDALAIVASKIDVHLDLVGEDTLEGELQRHAAAIGVDARVTFRGFLTQPRVLDRLRHADLYVQSSLHEAAGVSILEAAAAGIPAVGTDAGYISDWSPHMATAIQAPTAAALADAILAARAHPDRQRQIATAARDYALAHDAAFTAARFDELYRSLAR